MGRPALSPEALRDSLVRRLWSHVALVGQCWEWTGYRDQGYGNIRADRRLQRAHRVMYELLVGPIPAGLTLDHLCRNRACVNPDHLEPVTNRENILRGDTITARAAAATECPKGHPYSPENTYRRHGDGWRECRTCKAAHARQRTTARRHGHTFV